MALHCLAEPGHAAVEARTNFEMGLSPACRDLGTDSEFCSSNLSQIYLRELRGHRPRLQRPISESAARNT